MDHPHPPWGYPHRYPPHNTAPSLPRVPGVALGRSLGTLTALSVPFRSEVVQWIKGVPGARWDVHARVCRLPDSPTTWRILAEWGTPVRSADPESVGAQIPGKPDDTGRAPARHPYHEALEPLRRHLVLNGYSPRTRKVYLGHVRRFLIITTLTRSTVHSSSPAAGRNGRLPVGRFRLWWPEPVDVRESPSR